MKRGREEARTVCNRVGGVACSCGAGDDDDGAASFRTGAAAGVCAFLAAATAAGPAEGPTMAAGGAALRGMKGVEEVEEKGSAFSS